MVMQGGKLSHHSSPRNYTPGPVSYDINIVRWDINKTYQISLTSEMSRTINLRFIEKNTFLC